MEQMGTIRCGGVPMAILVQMAMTSQALSRFGSDELKKQFLAPSIAGDFVACVGVSEPGNYVSFLYSSVTERWTKNVSSTLLKI